MKKVPDRNGNPTISEQKKARVLTVIEGFEAQKREAEEIGLQFKAPTKSKIQRLAKVSKNYINLLANDDALYVRVEALRSRPATTQRRVGVEQTRLTQNKKLENQLQQLNAENCWLQDENHLLKLNLRQATAKVDQLLEYCLSVGKEPPKLDKIIDNSEIIEFPKND